MHMLCSCLLFFSTCWRYSYSFLLFLYHKFLLSTIIFISFFPSAELVWVQEEPKNMGAWSYVKPRFDTTLREGAIVRNPIRYGPYVTAPCPYVLLFFYAFILCALAFPNIRRFPSLFFLLFLLFLLLSSLLSFLPLFFCHFLLRYIGRKPSAAAATGGYKNHVTEQKEFIDRALSFDSIHFKSDFK